MLEIKDFDEFIDAIKFNMIRKFPPAATLLLKMKIKQSDKVRVAGVNDKMELIVNYENLKELCESISDGLFIMMHEMFHEYLKHVFEDAINKEKTNLVIVHIANVAMDAEINSKLIHMIRPSPTLREHGVFPTNDDKLIIEISDEKKITVNDVSKKNWEQIFKEIIGQLKQMGVEISGKGNKNGSSDSNSKGNSNSSSKKDNDEGKSDSNNSSITDDLIAVLKKKAMHGDVENTGKNEDGTTRTQRETEEKKREIDRTVAEALAQAKLMGSGSDSLTVLLESMLKPKVPWERVLRRYMMALVKDDYSLRRPHKRYLPYEMYVSSEDRRETVNAVFVIDTSGSMTGRPLKRVVSEVIGLVKRIPKTKLTIIFADDRVQEVFTHEDENKIDELIDKLKQTKGFGGTDFRPAFEKIKELREKPNVIIFATDGYGTFPEKRPNVPVVWLSTECPKDHYPFGKVIMVEV